MLAMQTMIYLLKESMQTMIYLLKASMQTMIDLLKSICCFSAKHAALRSKNKDWLAWY
jgi:hypothetical protein